MREKIKFILIPLLIVASIVVIVLYNNLKKEEKEEKRNQFKEEFEAYNDDYLKLEIPLNNPIIYATKEDILDIFDSTGIIFFASPTDDNSRN